MIQRQYYGINLGLLVILVISFSLMGIFALKNFDASITGFAVFEDEWEEVIEVSATNDEETIIHHIIFDEYKPKNCREGILVMTSSGKEIKYDILKSKNINNTCLEATIKFSNIIYDNSREQIEEVNDTSPDSEEEHPSEEVINKTNETQESISKEESQPLEEDINETKNISETVPEEVELLQENVSEQEPQEEIEEINETEDDQISGNVVAETEEPQEDNTKETETTENPTETESEENIIEENTQEPEISDELDASNEEQDSQSSDSENTDSYETSTESSSSSDNSDSSAGGLITGAVVGANVPIETNKIIYFIYYGNKIDNNIQNNESINNSVHSLNKEYNFINSYRPENRNLDYFLSFEERTTSSGLEIRETKTRDTIQLNISSNTTKYDEYLTIDIYGFYKKFPVYLITNTSKYLINDNIEYNLSFLNINNIKYYDVLKFKIPKLEENSHQIYELDTRCIKYQNRFNLKYMNIVAFDTMGRGDVVVSILNPSLIKCPDYVNISLDEAIELNKPEEYVSKIKVEDCDIGQAFLLCNKREIKANLSFQKKGIIPYTIIYHDYYCDNTSYFFTKLIRDDPNLFVSVGMSSKSL